MLARDIMTTNVVTVSPETTVEEVAKLITERGISGVPVVEENGNLVGIVSEGDIITRLKNLHIPTYFQLLGGVIYFEGTKKLENDLKKMTAYQVKDLMTKEVFSVGLEAPVEEIATLMAVKKINRVPVVEGEKLVGIISRADIVRTLIKSAE
ncbi:MAG TPA: CBS domain-containing protein [Bacillota bacterium]|nr:CBS domain-containing protein [Bacillota bacterium]